MKAKKPPPVFDVAYIKKLLARKPKKAKKEPAVDMDENTEVPDEPDEDAELV